MVAMSKQETELLHYNFTRCNSNQERKGRDM